MAVLNKGDVQPSALFVGGCVRNTLLGEEVGDIDIATVFMPQQVVQKLEAAGIKTIPTGIEHGTITAVIDKQSFEITTLRKDVETDGRRAVVAYTTDWKEDAQRRDFTINTLLMDTDGNIYDPTGQGVNDLNLKRIVFVGNPAQRIAEDHLRILRFFRFYVFYGAGDPDAAALKTIKSAADKIPTLSRERITQEMFKMLSVDDPADILALMFEHGVLNDLTHNSYTPEQMHHVCTFQNRYNLAFMATRLLVLAGFDADHISAMDKYLLIPKAFLKDMQAILGVLALPNLSDEHAVKVAIYKYGRVPTAQALMIELAQDRVMNGYAPRVVELIQNWDIPNCPVNGQDLMAAGIPAGPALGQRLDEIEQDWIDSGFVKNKKDLLQ